MEPLRSRTEGQVYEFTIYTFNHILGHLHTRTELLDTDYEKIGKCLLRLYQVWEIMWEKGRQTQLHKWRQGIRWIHTSGALKHIEPLLRADEGQMGIVVWELLNSEDFLLWALRQVGADVGDAGRSFDAGRILDSSNIRSTVLGLI